MKTLKALKHLFLGYKLHPKEHMRLNDLWINIRTGILTILFFILVIWLLSASGCFERPVRPDDFNQ
jgi:hypothetical protein